MNSSESGSPLRFDSDIKPLFRQREPQESSKRPVQETHSLRSQSQCLVCWSRRTRFLSSARDKTKL